MNLSKLGKIIFAVLSICALASGTFLVLAVNTVFYDMPNSGTIPAVGELTIYVNGSSTAWVNGTAVDWGVLAEGENTLPLDIKNTGNVNLTVTCAATDLPEEWTIGFSEHGDIAYVNQWLNGTVTLTVPVGATPDTYEWGFQINAT